MRYQIIACLFDPTIPCQQEALGNNVELLKKTQFEYDYITNESKPFSDRVTMLKAMYQIEGGAIEEKPFTDEYIIEQDGDGVYLYKRI